VEHLSFITEELDGSLKLRHWRMAVEEFTSSEAEKQLGLNRIV